MYVCSTQPFLLPRDRNSLITQRHHPVSSLNKLDRNTYIYFNFLVQFKTLHAVAASSANQTLQALHSSFGNASLQHVFQFQIAYRSLNICKDAANTQADKQQSQASGPPQQISCTGQAPCGKTTLSLSRVSDIIKFIPSGSLGCAVLAQLGWHPPVLHLVLDTHSSTLEAHWHSSRQK